LTTAKSQLQAVTEEKKKYINKEDVNRHGRTKRENTQRS
jgi:hypothetical protein